MKEMKLRHELKYYIDYSDYLAIRNRLRAVAKSDPHVGANGTYFIRSLYFDNYTDQVLREKIDGVNRREKFRIRYYNKDTTRITLEKKSKINGLCKKEQASMTMEQCQQLLSGEFEFLRTQEEPLFEELYAKMTTAMMRPQVVVDYEREPYIYELGNVRVTFDSSIRTGVYSKDFLNPSLPTIQAGKDTVRIMEVKYDEYLPEIIQMAVQIGNRSQTTFSKYAACRIYG